jgi:hypothetical protein
MYHQDLPPFRARVIEVLGVMGCGEVSFFSILPKKY